MTDWRADRGGGRGASAVEDAGARDLGAPDGHLELGPVLGLGDDLEATRVDDDRVLGTGRADARAPAERGARFEGGRAVGEQEGLAGRIAGHVPLVVEGPLVRMLELLVDAPGASEDVADLLAGAGEEDAGGVDHRGEPGALVEGRPRRAEGDGPRERGAEPEPSACDRDGGALPDRCGLEAGLPVSGEPIVAGDPEVDRDHALADQAVRQVARDVGLGLPLDEVPAGGLDRQRQGPAQLAESLTLEAGQGALQLAERVLGARPGEGRLPDIAGDLLGMGELGDDPAGVVIPGTLLELEAEAGHLLLEDTGTLDIIGDDGPAGPVDIQQDYPRLR